MEEKKSFGPLIGIVIIIALVVVGGLYFLKNEVLDTPVVTPEENQITTEVAPISSGDDLDSLENDLKVTPVVNY